MTDATAERPNVLRRVLSYLVLPQEVTQFEDQYLARINRVALMFFYWHLPVFALIAWANETGVALTMVLTALTLTGPTLAVRTLKSRRSVSMVHSFTAMCMGGILVHIGQGPMQIEMHFYFFSVLAMLALFGNPMAIVVAAATVSVHHLALWWLLPDSVFNYDAPIWVVLVHATFVILETVAACYIARNFFDNVIGLEKKVAAATVEIEARSRDMQLVLDNVSQGFLTLGRDGVLSQERSTIADEWFGPYEKGTTFQELLGRHDSAAAEWFEMGFDEILDGFMPLEVTLDQLPKQAAFDGKIFRIDYTPICEEGSDELSKLLIVVSNITAEIESNRAEQQRREILGVFERLLRDRLGFLEFYDEAQRLIDAIPGNLEKDRQLAKRQIHTLKGNTAVYGLASIANRCHEIEDQLVEGGEGGAARATATLTEEWADLRTTVDRMLGNHEKDTVTLTGDDYDALLQSVIRGTDHVEIARQIAHFRLEPTEIALSRLADQARTLAQRLEKGTIEVAVESNDLRVQRERFSSLWAALNHVIRNAVDHGIEEPHERTEAGKSPQGRVHLRTREDDDEFVIEVRDDGRGVDWDRIRECAEEQGMPSTTETDLVQALFNDGLTTRTEISDVSGRGIGMSAVRSECEALGGRIEVISERGRGTVFELRFPKNATHDEPVLAPA